MSKTMFNRNCDFDMDFVRPVNRKRSKRWLSDETRLLNKYGLSTRYMDMYAA